MMPHLQVGRLFGFELNLPTFEGPYDDGIDKNLSIIKIQNSKFASSIFYLVY